MTMQLLCVGEAMAELRQDAAGFAVGFAGDSFNTAIYWSRVLKKPGAVGYLTRIGEDPLSEGFLRLARAEGLDCAAIGRDPERNIGIYSVRTDQAGERSFHYWRAASAARQLFRSEDEFAPLGQCAILYFSAITLAILPAPVRAGFLERVADLRRTHGVAVAFDLNYRPRLWESLAAAREAVNRAWCLTDIALPSIDDEMALFGDVDEESVLARLRCCGCRQGALKRAAAGPLALEDTGVALPPFAPAEHVLDSTAAGDSFNGAYLAGMISGADINTCLSWGHEMARQVVAKRGAIVDVPLDGFVSPQRRAAGMEPEHRLRLEKLPLFEKSGAKTLLVWSVALNRHGLKAQKTSSDSQTMEIAHGRRKAHQVHQHFWRYSPAEFPWIDAAMNVLQRDFLPPELTDLLRRAGIDASIAVQARARPEETDWLLALARDIPAIAGVVGWASLTASDFSARLEAWAQDAAFCGLRPMLRTCPTPPP